MDVCVCLSTTHTYVVDKHIRIHLCVRFLQSFRSAAPPPQIARLMLVCWLFKNILMGVGFGYQDVMAVIDLSRRPDPMHCRASAGRTSHLHSKSPSTADSFTCPGRSKHVDQFVPVVARAVANAQSLNASLFL